MEIQVIKTNGEVVKINFIERLEMRDNLIIIMGWSTDGNNKEVIEPLRNIKNIITIFDD